VQGGSLPLWDTSRIRCEGTTLFDLAFRLFLRRGLRRVMISHWADALRLTQYKSSSSTSSHSSSQNNNGTLCRMAILCWQGCSVVLCSAGATRRWCVSKAWCFATSSLSYAKILSGCLNQLPGLQHISLLFLQGRVFLDRDPKHFRLILNYLRDGEVCLPACPQELQEVLQEALFYQVCGLVAYSDNPSSLAAL